MKADEYDGIQATHTTWLQVTYHQDHVTSSFVKLWFKYLSGQREIKTVNGWKKRIRNVCITENKRLLCQRAKWCCMIQVADSLDQLLSDSIGCWSIQQQEELKVVAVIKSLVFSSGVSTALVSLYNGNKCFPVHTQHLTELQAQRTVNQPPQKGWLTPEEQWRMAPTPKHNQLLNKATRRLWKHQHYRGNKHSLTTQG